MRLWHEKLISKLPNRQLLGQHRECCAMRGNGWGRKHSTVDYVYAYSPMNLMQYHKKVIQEMNKRGYKVEMQWLISFYRGSFCKPWDTKELLANHRLVMHGELIYNEHNKEYMLECLDNLNNKGVYIDAGALI